MCRQTLYTSLRRWILSVDWAWLTHCWVCGGPWNTHSTERLWICLSRPPLLCITAVLPAGPHCPCSRVSLAPDSPALLLILRGGDPLVHCRSLAAFGQWLSPHPQAWQPELSPDTAKCPLGAEFPWGPCSSGTQPGECSVMRVAAFTRWSLGPPGTWHPVGETGGHRQPRGHWPLEGW